MHVYLKISKLVRICLLVCLSSILVVSIFGFKDIYKKDVAFKFRGRIIEKPADQQGLVVKKIPAIEIIEKRIFVLVTKHTIIRSEGRKIGFDDLRVGMSTLIEGTKEVQRINGRDIMIVQAHKIKLLLE